MNESFIKLYRKFKDWEWYDDIPTKVLFIHLILEANFADAKWRGEEIKRGTIHTGRYKLAKETGLTENQIRRALKNLESTREITIKTTNKKSVIELKNYNEYQQNHQQKHQQITNKNTNKTPTNNQQTTTVKEEVEEKEEKEIVTKVTAAKAETYGNPEINKILNYIKVTLGLSDFKESQKLQRQYARHLLNLGKKIELTEFNRRFLIITGDAFKSKNCNSLKYLYSELKSVPSENSIISNSSSSEIPIL